MERLFPLTEVLVLRAQTGDRDAFATLAELWQAVLRSHAERLCAGFGRRGEQWAAEASQEAWLSIARGIGGLDDPRAFGAWAMRIVARRVADRARRAKRDRIADARAAVSERGEVGRGGGTGGGSDRDTLATLRVALAAARAEDRALLGMVYGRGMDIAAIADVLGVAEGTVKSRVSRAKRRLRQAIERIG